MPSPVHFVAGLPRSGSTLLAAILRQNPAVVAHMTSPAAEIFRRMIEATSRRQEASVFITPDARARLLGSVLPALYGDAWGAKTIFDTSRFWASRMDALALLYSDFRMIACVRDVGWILDSFERLYRRNPLEASGVYNFEVAGTVYSRTTGLASSAGPVGFALDALREALAGPEASRILLVEYDDLCAAPRRTLARIYRHVGLPSFRHDFNAVAFEAPEFDLPLGAPGLHSVRSRVESPPQDRKPVLPPDLFARFANDQFWREG